MHARWLAEAGHDVTLIDTVPERVEVASSRCPRHAPRRPASCLVLARSFRDLPVDVFVTLLENGSDGKAAPTSGFPGGHHHTATELADEATDAGFVEVVTVGVEGAAGFGLEMLPPEEAVVAAGLMIADAADATPPLADLSPHLMSIGVTPAEDA